MIHSRTKRKAAGESVRKAKVAVTLPAPVLDLARQRIGAGEAASLSAFVTKALEEKLERDRLQEVLDEILAEHPPTPEDLAWADRVLGI